MMHLVDVVIFVGSCCSLTSLILFCVGMAGISTDHATVRTASWVSAKVENAGYSDDAHSYSSSLYYYQYDDKAFYNYNYYYPPSKFAFMHNRILNMRELDSEDNLRLYSGRKQATISININLAAVVFTTSFASDRIEWVEWYEWSDCTEDNCKDCRYASTVVAALVATSLSLTCLSTVFNCFLVFKKKELVRRCGTGTSVLACIFAATSLGCYSDCVVSLYSWLPDGVSPSIDTGYASVLFGCAIMGLVVFMLSSFVVSHDNDTSGTTFFNRLSMIEDGSENIIDNSTQGIGFPSVAHCELESEKLYTRGQMGTQPSQCTSNTVTDTRRMDESDSPDSNSTVTSVMHRIEIGSGHDD